MHIDVNGTTLWYEKVGSGPPMLLIHGNGGSNKVFRRASEILSPYFTLYMPDTRGHGKSRKHGSLHYDDFAGDLAAFCKALDLKNIYFVGHSDGGITGLILLSRHPGLIREAFICGANLTPAGFHSPVKGAISLWNKLDRRDRVRLMLREPWLTAEDLGRIDVPVHVTAGQFDIVRREESEAIVSALPKGDLKIFSGSGHNAYILYSGRLARYVLSTLSPALAAPGKNGN